IHHLLAQRKSRRIVLMTESFIDIYLGDRLYIRSVLVIRWIQAQLLVTFRSTIQLFRTAVLRCRLHEPLRKTQERPQGSPRKNDGLMTLLAWLMFPSQS